MEETQLQVFEAVRAVAEEALRQAEMAVVDNATAAERENNRRLELGKIEKRIDEVAKDLAAPWKAKLDELNAYKNDLKAKVSAGKQALIKKLEKWQNEELAREQERKEQERKQAELEAQNTRMDDNASFDEVLAADEKVVIASKPVEMSKAFAPMAMRKVWKFRVTDPSKLPLEFLMPNETLIGQRVRAANNPLRACEGLEIWEEETPTGR